MKRVVHLPTINELVELAGGMAGIKKQAVKIENDPYMALSLDYAGDFRIAGTSFPGLSVCHYGEQNGDLMRDPDMVFAGPIAIKKGDDPLFAPLTFRNDYVGIDRSVFVDDEGRKYNPHLLDDLCSFAVQWDQNLKDQGFIEAARWQILGETKKAG